MEIIQVVDADVITILHLVVAEIINAVSFKKRKNNSSLFY